MPAETRNAHIFSLKVKGINRQNPLRRKAFMALTAIGTQEVHKTEI